VKSTSHRPITRCAGSEARACIESGWAHARWGWDGAQRRAHLLKLTCPCDSAAWVKVLPLSLASTLPNRHRSCFGLPARSHALRRVACRRCHTWKLACPCLRRAGRRQQGCPCRPQPPEERQVAQSQPSLRSSAGYALGPPPYRTLRASGFGMSASAPALERSSPGCECAIHISYGLFRLFRLLACRTPTARYAIRYRLTARRMSGSLPDRRVYSCTGIRIPGYKSAD